MSVKEQYWRYSLVVIILGLGTIIFVKLLPFLGGLLGALTIYILVRKQMFSLTEKRHIRRGLAAAIVLCESILCFLIPMSLVVWLVVNKLQGINLDPGSIIEPAKHIAQLVEEKTGYDLLVTDNLVKLAAWIPKIGQLLMEWISGFAVNIFVLIFVLYFMLVGGRKMEAYLDDILPFNKAHTQEVLHEIKMIVQSNAIGIPLLALIQGFVALVGYWIFGVPSAVLFGLLTCFATIIPDRRHDAYLGADRDLPRTQRQLGECDRVSDLRFDRRFTVRQPDPLRPAKEDGRHSSADYDFRRGDRPVPVRFYGRDFRAADAGDLHSVCQHVQKGIPRQETDGKK